MAKRKAGHPANVANTKRKSVKTARAKIFSELQIKGVPVNEIAASYGLTKRQVMNVTRWAEEQGIIEAVGDRMVAQLQKVPNIYAAILDASPEELSEEGIRKARELQLKAARDLSKGYLFAKGSVTLKKTETLGLDDFYKLRAARAGEVVTDEPERLPVPELPRVSIEGGDED